MIRWGATIGLVLAATAALAEEQAPVAAIDLGLTMDQVAAPWWRLDAGGDTTLNFFAGDANAFYRVCVGAGAVKVEVFNAKGAMAAGDSLAAHQCRDYHGARILLRGATDGSEGRYMFLGSGAAK